MEQAQKLWEMVLDVWDSGFWGSNMGQVFTALAVLYGFFAIRHLFAKFIMGWFKIMTRRTKTTMDDALVEALSAPLSFIPIVIGVFVAGGFLELEPEMSDIHTKLIHSLIIFVIFWGFHNMVGTASFLFGKMNRVMTKAMAQWLSKSIRYILIFLGVAIVLETWGVEVGPLLAGLGLFGVAVALGAQDLFKNLISGILVILERRFNPGDFVKVDGVVEGIVEKIGFRSTIVRRLDKAPVYVPNTKFSDAAVTNFSGLTNRRILWTIGVEYSATADQLKKVCQGIEKYLIGHKDFVQPPELSIAVRVDSFNASSIDILVLAFTHTTDWLEFIAVKEALAYKVKEVVEKAGTGFAFPSQSLYVESLPGGTTPEAFSPPAEKKTVVKKAAPKKAATKKADAKKAPAKKATKTASKTTTKKPAAKKAKK